MKTHLQAEQQDAWDLFLWQILFLSKTEDIFSAGKMKQTQTVSVLA